MRIWIWFLITFGLLCVLWGMQDDNSWLRIGGALMLSSGVLAVTSKLWPSERDRKRI